VAFDVRAGRGRNRAEQTGPDREPSRREDPGERVVVDRSTVTAPAKMLLPRRSVDSARAGRPVRESRRACWTAVSSNSSRIRDGAITRDTTAESLW
jgi:hypothetical protein